MPRRLVSKVWHIPKLIGNAIPGALVFDNGKIAFITAEGVEFHVPVSEIGNIRWPWLRMGFGFDGTVNNKKYKFSFSKPNHSAADITIQPGNPLPSVRFAGSRFYDLSSLSTIKADRETTRQWKMILNSIH